MDVRITLLHMATQKPMEVIPFRLPVPLVRRLDRLAERMRKTQPGVRFTRADVVRHLLATGLDAAEARGATEEGRHGTS